MQSGVTLKTNEAIIHATQQFLELYHSDFETYNSCNKFDQSDDKINYNDSMTKETREEELLGNQN